MLFAFRSDQLQSSTCEESSVELRQELSQFFLGNVVGNGYSPASCPSDEVIVDLKNIGVIIEENPIGLTNWLRQNADHWLVIDGPIAVLLIIVALVVSLPLIMDVVEGQLSFKTMWRSREFLVSPQQGHQVVLNSGASGLRCLVVKVLDVVVEFEI
jgi:hypothetical protein